MHAAGPPKRGRTVRLRQRQAAETEEQQERHAPRHGQRGKDGPREEARRKCGCARSVGVC